MLKTAGREAFVHQLPHVGRRIPFGKTVRRSFSERRSVFNRQLIKGQMRRCRRKRRGNFRFQLLFRLSRQGVHHVQIDVLKRLVRRFNRLHGVRRRVNAPESL